MSRLPDLERALFDAAARLDAQAMGQAAKPQARRHARRWRRRGTPLLAGLAGLLVAGGAVAAATGLLDRGDPVPVVTGSLRALVPGANGFTLASVRAADPDGGPAWGIGTYEAVPPPTGARVTCVVVGRIQDARLGVVGRDGVFGNDGRFHTLAPAAQSSSVCGGRADGGRSC